MEAILAGGKLQRCRTAFLDEVKDARHALIVGEGNGRFLSALLGANSSVRILCVDGSARMLDCTRHRLQRAGLDSNRVEFIHADVTSWTPPEASFDLIATHFFLDCFRPEQINEIVKQLSRASAPNARWLISDFYEPARGPARWRARSMLALMYWFFRAATQLSARHLTAPDTFLERHGFQLQSRLITEWGLLHADFWKAGRKRDGNDPVRYRSHV